MSLLVLIYQNNLENVEHPSHEVKISMYESGGKPHCPIGSKASTNYTGRLENGTIFDSNTIARFGHVTPFDFTVGEG